MSLVAAFAGAGALEAMLPANLDVELRWRVVGAGLVLLIGVALLLWAMRSLARANTSIEPHQAPSALVTSGPFRYSRNPMYLANVLMLLGFAVLTCSAWFAAATVAQFVLLNGRVIPDEEARLKRLFPDGAATWFRTTRRWI